MSIQFNIVVGWEKQEMVFGFRGILGEFLSLDRRILGFRAEKTTAEKVFGRFLMADGVTFKGEKCQWRSCSYAKVCTARALLG